MFVLKHRDLPVPLMLTPDAHAAVKDAASSGKQVIVLGDYVLNVAMVSVISQEQFLISDEDELAKRGKARCKWGTVHSIEAKHDCRETECARCAERGSPFVLPGTWASHEYEVLEADAFRSGDASTLRASVLKLEERFVSGDMVLRELVRVHRKDPNLLSDEIGKLIERFAAVPLSSIPNSTYAELAGT